MKQLLSLGKSHYLRGEYEQAERCLAEVVEHGQAFADVYNMLGVIYHDWEEVEEARAAFEEALNLNPGYTEAALNLAVIYNDEGRYEEAKDLYRRAREKNYATKGNMDHFVLGKVANMYAEIGDVFASSGVWDKAIREYRNALELCPDFVDIRMRLAGALRDKGEKDSAVSELESAVASRPEHLPARVALGVALFSAGRTDDAMACWEHVLRENPDDRTANMYLRLVRGTGTS